MRITKRTETEEVQRESYVIEENTHAYDVQIEVEPGDVPIISVIVESPEEYSRVAVPCWAAGAVRDALDALLPLLTDHAPSDTSVEPSQKARHL